jgi:DinB superfamily
MQGAEKSELLDALRAGREVLGHALANVDEALAHRTPDSAGWSILQCMEHMVESERYLLSRLRLATAAEHQQENRACEAKIAAIASDRTQHIQTPRNGTSCRALLDSQRGPCRIRRNPRRGRRLGRRVPRQSSPPDNRSSIDSRTRHLLRNAADDGRAPRPPRETD